MATLASLISREPFGARYFLAPTLSSHEPVPNAAVGSRSPHRRIAEIDALRGLAAVAVLLTHYVGTYDFYHNLSCPLDYATEFGNYGVHLFFVISGFVILMTLERCRTILDFVVSRFSRIFPAYWASVLITFATLCLFHPSSRSALSVLLVNFTMLERFLGMRHIDQVYWTLNVEMSFYIWMIVLFRCGALARIERVIPWVLLFQLALAFYARWSGYVYPQGLKVVLLIEYAHLFCAGMLFFHLWQDGFSGRRALLLIWCLFNQTLVRFRDFDWMPAPVWGDLVVAGIFLVMLLVVYGKMSWLVHPVLLFLGSISYSLYLLHHEIGIAIMECMLSHGYSRWLGFVAASGTALMLATLVSFLIEKPSMKLIRSRYPPHKARAKGPAPSPRLA